MSTLEGGENWPGRLIIGTEDLIEDYIEFLAEGGITLSEHDLEEIVTQIVMIFLNQGLSALVDLGNLPDYSRLVHVSFVVLNHMGQPGPGSDTVKLSLMKIGTVRLGINISKRIRDVGAHRGGNFPYAFEDMIGRDVLLTLLPY